MIKDTGQRCIELDEEEIIHAIQKHLRDKLYNVSLASYEFKIARGCVKCIAHDAFPYPTIEGPDKC